MAAWDDDMTWSARDENRDFDGVAGYPGWDGDPELAALRGLREALVELNALVVEFVRAVAA